VITYDTGPEMLIASLEVDLSSKPPHNFHPAALCLLLFEKISSAATPRRKVAGKFRFTT
jgi:hypothetical protein